MAKPTSRRIAALWSGLKTEGELTAIITQIVDVIADEDMFIELRLQELKRQELSLDKLAQETEYKIKQQQINKIRKAVLSIIKKSTNRMLLAAIKPVDN